MRRVLLFGCCCLLTLACPGTVVGPQDCAFSDGVGVVRGRCLSCHSVDVTQVARAGATVGVDFDTWSLDSVFNISTTRGDTFRRNWLWPFRVQQLADIHRYIDVCKYCCDERNNNRYSKDYLHCRHDWIYRLEWFCAAVVGRWCNVGRHVFARPRWWRNHFT